MRRALAAVAAALVLLPAGPAAAKSFSLADADVHLRVARDGGVLVREAITFDFDGSFTGAYRDIPLRAGERIDLVSVSEGRTPYRPGGLLILGTEGPPSQFAQGVVAGRERIIWRYRAADQRRTFVIRYRISGLARAYDDVVDVDLQVWGDTWMTGLGRLRATMTAPGPVRGDNARIYGHPVSVHGDTAFAQGEARLRALRIPKQQFVEMRLLFDRSMLTSTARAKVVPGAARDRIMAEERDDAASYEANRRRIDDALHHVPRSLLLLLIAALAPAAIILTLIWLVLSRERKVAGYDREYEQEPPSDDPPALVAPLLRQSTKPGGAEFTATVFDFIRRGILTAEPVTTESWSWGTLGRRPQPDLLITRAPPSTNRSTALERGVDRILERALGGGPQRLSALPARFKAKQAANAASYTSWQDKIAKEFERRHWYDSRGATAILVAAGAMTVIAATLIVVGVAGLKPRTARYAEWLQIALGVAATVNAIVLFAALASEPLRRRWSPEAAMEAARWAAFRRYLRDFPRLEEAPPSSVALWERLLVYGIAFGLADRVLQAAKIAAPEALPRESHLYATGYSSGGEGFYSGSSLSGMSSGFSSALAPASSGSDGGGGAANRARAGAV